MLNTFPVDSLHPNVAQMVVLWKVMPGHMLGTESGVGTARHTAGCTARHIAPEGDLRR